MDDQLATALGEHSPPGAVLKELIYQRYGIDSNANCNCDAYVATMNTNGARWCERNIQAIKSWLLDGAKKSGWLPRLGVKLIDLEALIREAIAISKSG